MYVWFWIFSKFQLKSPVSNPESNELGQKCNQQHTCPVYSHIQSFPLRITPNAIPDARESTCGVKRFQLWFLPSTHSAVILHAQNGDFIFSDGLQLFALSHREKGVEWLLCWHTGRDPVNIAEAPVQFDKMGLPVSH